MTEHTIEALCRRSHEISKSKGWVNDTDERPFHTAFILMVSEVSEALEDWRNNKKVDELYYEAHRSEGSLNDTFILSTAGFKELKEKHPELIGKPCGIPVELADLVIRICQRVGTDGHAKELQVAFDSINDTTTYSLHGYSFERFLAETTKSLCDAWTVWEAEQGGEESSANKNEHLDCLAEALVRTFAFAHGNEIALWTAIDEKEAYNKTRPARHGGKKC